MKHLAAAILAASLCACGVIKTNEVQVGAGIRVPADRVLANQAAEPGMANFTITRDTGYLGGGCYLAVEIDRKLAARFDTGEMASFYVKPGRVELSVLSDPLGRGLCGALGFAPVRETYDLQPEKTTRFRLSSRQYRRPELESNDIEPVDEIAVSPAASAAPPAAAMPPPTSTMATPRTDPTPAPTGIIPTPAASTQPSRAAGDTSNKERKYQISAETFAKARQCAPHPVASLVAWGPGSETYSIPCSSGSTLITRCDFGHCLALP